jgi:hypothetical protein
VRVDEENQFDGYVTDYPGDPYEVPETPNGIIEAKVSSDDGLTWARRDIDLGGEIDESGLCEGEIFQINGERYRVVLGDFGLMIELLNKPEKKSSKRK